MKQEETHRVTKSMADKAALHALVLALHVSAYTVSSAELSADLLMPPAAIASLLRATGCKVASDKDAGHKATLTVPLTFPVRRRKRG